MRKSFWSSDNGLLVMSQKAPSFPLIRLDINPIEWLSFNYFHAWIASDVVDTTSLYPTENGDSKIRFFPAFQSWIKPITWTNPQPLNPQQLVSTTA